MSRTKTATAFAVSAVTLALAVCGCGSGSSSSGQQTPRAAVSNFLSELIDHQYSEACGSLSHEVQQDIAPVSDVRQAVLVSAAQTIPSNDHASLSSLRRRVQSCSTMLQVASTLLGAQLDNLRSQLASSTTKTLQVQGLAVIQAGSAEWDLVPQGKRWIIAAANPLVTALTQLS